MKLFGVGQDKQLDELDEELEIPKEEYNDV
jgi:hypothetical protein